MELQGTLQDFSLEAVLDLIAAGHKTGKLSLALKTASGSNLAVELLFFRGAIVDVSAGRLRGLPALQEAAVCPEGNFAFSVLEAREGVQVSPIPVDAAIATIRKAREEAGVLPAAATLLHYGHPAGPTITLSPQEFHVLACMQDGMKVGDLLAATGLPTVTGMHTLAGLLSRGLLASASAPAGKVVDPITELAYEGMVSLVDFTAGKPGVELFRRCFPSDASPQEWKNAVPTFRVAFQRLAGPDKTTQVLAELHSLTG